MSRVRVNEKEKEIKKNNNILKLRYELVSPDVYTEMKLNFEITKPSGVSGSTRHKPRKKNLSINEWI